VALGFKGLQRLFAGDGGAVPTPEGGAQTSSAAQRMAMGEGAATDDEVLGIDAHSGIDRVDADESVKDLMRIDYVVNYWLQNGEGEKAEAAAASLMMRGSTEVKRAGQIAAVALEAYQESKDPKDLKNASDAIKHANSIIPDGINLKIDIDPKTHEVLATVIDADGKEQTTVVDPAAVPEMLQEALTGSAYWKAAWRIGHPALAQQEMSDEAATERSAAKSAYDEEAEWRKNEREKGEEQDRWERNATLKLWEKDFDINRGETAGERSTKEVDAYYDDWAARMAETTDPAERKALVNEGMQYRFDNTPARKTPIVEPLIFGAESAYGSTFDEEDLAAIRNMASLIADKNSQVEGSRAMELAGALIMAPELGNDPDGTLIVDNNSLVFNPGLLPQLYKLRSKYGQQ
jgi:hypothetical protein